MNRKEFFELFQDVVNGSFIYRYRWDVTQRSVFLLFDSREESESFTHSWRHEELEKMSESVDITSWDCLYYVLKIVEF